MSSTANVDNASMHVALFATCLVDMFRPNAGFAAVALLESAGCSVDVPALQTCCGQPAYNNGDLKNSRKIAKQVIELFSDYDYVVVPSASCAGMLKLHYPALFKDDPQWLARAKNFSQRCYELIGFLYDVIKIRNFPIREQGAITYHDSCASLREVPSQHKVRSLLSCCSQIQFIEAKDSEVCCGFGGTFCVKYPEISTSMLDDKVANIEATGASLLVSADMGCLLHIAGRFTRLNKPLRIYHVAELLAGMTDIPGIGEGEGP